jgi:hypothetical protein
VSAQAHIVDADHFVNNGVVHGIDALLMPPVCYPFIASSKASLDSFHQFPEVCDLFCVVGTSLERGNRHFRHAAGETVPFCAPRPSLG